MDLLNKLTIKNLKLNKKRSIVTIIGILLSVALITAVSSMYSSFIDSTIRYEKIVKGNFHVKYEKVPFDDIRVIEKNTRVESVQILHNLGYAKIKNPKDEHSPYLYISAVDSTAMNDWAERVVQGRLPKNEDEIVIPEHLRTNAKVKLTVGETITLTMGKRISDGQELTQKDPFSGEDQEEFVTDGEKTYTIVGIMKRPVTAIESHTAPGYTFLTFWPEDKPFDTADLLVTYNKKGIKDNLGVTANILGVDKELYRKANAADTEDPEQSINAMNEVLDKAKYTYCVNDYLLKLQTNPLSVSTNKRLGGIVLVVCLIIVFTSVFCIKNSFDISITEKTKQYGLLKSVGATKKQIKKNVLFEAMILGALGIPLGILSGLFAAFLLVKISDLLLVENLLQDLKLVYSVDGFAILLSVLLGIVTIYFSAIKSARKASRVTTIELIRNSGQIQINEKKLRIPRYVRLFFGIGGILSFKNIKRNKKRYRATVVSLTISIATFIALFFFTSEMQTSVEMEYKTTPYNFSYLVKDIDKNKEKIEQTTKLDTIKEYSTVRVSFYDLMDPKYNSEVSNAASREGETISVNVIAVGEEAYEGFVRKLGLKQEEAKDKAILVDVFDWHYFENGEKKRKDSSWFAYQKGDMLTGTVAGDSSHTIQMEIAQVTDQAPFALNAKDMEMLILSDEMFDELQFHANYVNAYFDSTDPDKLQEEIEGIFEDEFLSTDNTKENKKQVDNLLLLVNIFLFGFIIVISLIGITNVYNTITTSMELRKQEFAMLKSIGMTKREFDRMINLESIFIGGKALLYGTLIGSILSLVIYLMNREENEVFSYPFLAVFLCILVVMVLILTLMRYSINKINKQNTIETIRNENI